MKSVLRCVNLVCFELELRWVVTYCMMIYFFRYWKGYDILNFEMKYKVYFPVGYFSTGYLLCDVPQTETFF